MRFAPASALLELAEIAALTNPRRLRLVTRLRESAHARDQRVLHLDDRVDEHLDRRVRAVGASELLDAVTAVRRTRVRHPPRRGVVVTERRHVLECVRD